MRLIKDFRFANDKTPLHLHVHVEIGPDESEPGPRPDENESSGPRLNAADLPRDRGIKSFILRYWCFAALSLFLLFWISPVWSIQKDLWFTHCSWYVPQRAIAVLETWKVGLWDARWIPVFDTGYGYPFHSFYAPAFSWISALLLSFIPEVTLVIRLHLFLWMAAGTLGMYLASERFWRYVQPDSARDLPFGFIAAAAWLFSPTLLSDAYVRGDLAELAAIQLFPWIFWVATGLLAPAEKWSRADSVRLLWLAFILSLCILMHNFMALVSVSIALLMIPIMLWIRYFDPNDSLRSLAYFPTRTLITVGGVIGSLVLTAFFWMPAMKEAELTGIPEMAKGAFHYASHFLHLSNLLNVSLWGFGGSVIGPKDGMPLHLGWMGCLGLFSGLAGLFFSFVFYSRRKDRVIAAIIALITCSAVGLFLTFSASTPIWRAVGILQMAQFPWRLLVVPAFGIALLAPAWLVSVESRFIRKVFLSMLLALVFISAGMSCVNYVKIERSLGSKNQFDPKTWAVTRVTTTDIDEYRPKWVPAKRTSPYAAGTVVASPPVTFLSARGNGVRVTAELENASASAQGIMVALNYFPGWKAKVLETGTRLEVSPDPKTGFIQVAGVPPGKSQIRVWFGNSPVRMVGKTLSAAGWLAWCCAMGYLMWPARWRRAMDQAPSSEPNGLL